MCNRWTTKVVACRHMDLDISLQVNPYLRQTSDELLTSARTARNRAPFWAHMGPKYRILGIFELNMGENEPRRYSNAFLYRFGSISTKFQPEPPIPRPFQTNFRILGDFWVSYSDLFFDKYMGQP